ncbi:hypothetical protein [Lysinibacillus sp. G4S2]|uniref:hypothetical protein n=1 Tax=Lysinibacillus sp. G4S2 TaxID=3055859 RepID=UPI0025A1B9C7|nr:hypothetical protein [Lysinibacillus sp. G4S2]MDM5246024.1 hypothetical protein [Lysinibacillus sp. G4S2]
MAKITGSREYMANLTLSYSEVEKVMTAQQVIYEKGLVKLESNSMITALGPVATVLGLAFVTSTPAGIAAGVAGIISGLVGSAKAELDSLVKNGYWELGKTRDFLKNNPKYTHVELKLPFIEYTLDAKDKIRFITGKGVLVRVKTSTGWIPFE